MKRKGIEEMVGFVVVIALVSVGLVIFLGLSLLRGNQQIEDNYGLERYLDSVMEVTSECAIGFIPAYANIGELIRECAQGKNCVGGKDACVVLEDMLPLVLNQTFTNNTAYSFTSYYSLNEQSREEVITLGNRECAQYTGTDYVMPGLPGNIITRLEVCSKF